MIRTYVRTKCECVEDANMTDIRYDYVSHVLNWILHSQHQLAPSILKSPNSHSCRDIKCIIAQTLTRYMHIMFALCNCSGTSGQDRGDGIATRITQNNNNNNNNDTIVQWQRPRPRQPPPWWCWTKRVQETKILPRIFKKAKSSKTMIMIDR